MHEDQVKDHRKKISIAKAELERLKDNKRITKKGKKNRKLLLEECKRISAESLVSYIEKKKTELRKSGKRRSKKQEV